MSQNTPHDPSGPAQAPGPNPYSANQQASAVPDLDAGAPVLKSADLQRMNRKALVFLAGIVVLLLLGATWLFNSALSSDDSDRRPVEEERVVIPEAPKDVALPQLPPESSAPELPMPLPLADVPPDMPMPPEMSGAPRGPSLLERRLQGGAGVSAGESGASGGPSDAYAQMGGAGGPLSVPDQMRESEASVQPLYQPDTLLVRGTFIRCVMETRIITDVPGFTSCIVTEPVYSINGQRLLLPKGSKVLGTYGTDAIGGNRVAVVWDRITTPNGLNINMSNPGVDNLGSAGHPGHYDAHWPERISSALLISLVSDAFKYAGAKHGPQETSIADGVVVQSPYESNTARTMERLANMALDKSMSRPATVTINQGEIVNVYVAQDVDFSVVLR